MAAAPRFRLSCLALVAALALAACGHDTATPANAPASGRTVRIADGPLVAQVQNLREVQPDFELTPPSVTVPLVFATVRSDARKTADPVILRKEGRDWRIQQFLDLHQQEWVYAGVISERNEIWAAVDGAPGLNPPSPPSSPSGTARSTQITLVRSTDAGATWTTFSAVAKPSRDAEFDSFNLAATGEGTLTVHVDEPSEGVRAGIYHYQTKDAGKTWTGPTFEPNDMEDAPHTTGTIPEVLRDIDTGNPAQ